MPRRRKATAGAPTLAEQFEQLHLSYAPALLAYLQSRTYSAQVAADLCAETFAVALESWDRFDPAEGDPQGWLWGISKNLLRRYQRNEAVDAKARRRMAFRTNVVAEDDLDMIDSRDETARMIETVSAALTQLSPAVALAVRSRVMEERPYPEVADICGCSVDSARARVSRGLTQLLDLTDDPDSDRRGIEVP